MLDTENFTGIAVKYSTEIALEERNPAINRQVKTTWQDFGDLSDKTGDPTDEKQQRRR